MEGSAQTDTHRRRGKGVLLRVSRCWSDLYFFPLLILAYSGSFSFLPCCILAPSLGTGLVWAGLRCLTRAGRTRHTSSIFLYAATRAALRLTKGVVRRGICGIGGWVTDV